MFPNFDKIYLACGYTDFRKQMDGLISIIKFQFNLDPTSNSLFIFCNRSMDKIKIIHYDYNGYWLYYKRLSSGKFEWPRNNLEIKNITSRQLKFLLEGISIDSKIGFKRKKISTW